MTNAIHRYWSGPPSPVAGWTEEALKSFHPGVPIHLWGPGDFEVEKDQVRSEDQDRHESNVIRYKVLHEFGGLWLDHDVVPLCNLFDATEDNWTAGMKTWRIGFAMRFDSKHPFLSEVLSRIDSLPPSTNSSPDVSGIGMLNQIQSDVPIEFRVNPIDAGGRSTRVDNPIAVHLWETSRRRHSGK